MSQSPLAPGRTVRVKSRGKVVPAVVVGSIRATKLVWVRINGEEATLVRFKDVLDDQDPLPGPEPDDDPSLWETEVF